ncbi:MAG: bifunctional adenosylcobinamide kinase/adenosylcobinamide-phosphate guanylyltransferase [Nitrospiria bacterium]
MSEDSKVLVLGGARSGKSRFASEQAEKLPGKKVFMATCQPFDPEMKDRIALHRQRRDASWETVEEFFNLADRIKEMEKTYSVILVDCLTLWLSNWVLKEEQDTKIREEIGRLLEAVQERRTPIILVTNETGMGIVPPTLLGRRFRDLQGELNQVVAGVVNRIYLMVAGIPLKIK